MGSGKCKLCGKKLPPKRTKFCCNRHKDRYHNIHNPRGLFAYAKWATKETDIEDTFHPQDPYSLGQE